MRILLTGGTGLIGTALCRRWRDQGHTLWVLSRTPERVATHCAGAQGVAALQDLPAALTFDAVVNLAGAPIADRPWTRARRTTLTRSRVDLTHALVDWMRASPHPPAVLLSASAVGWYGDRGETPLDETSAPGGDDFGSRLCMAWEDAAQAASEFGVRVAQVRLAPVLTAQGGMLRKLLPAYRLGLGGKLGNGRQWLPWIHLDDAVGLFDYLLHASACHGAFNGCAPTPVRNADFARTLAATLGRPAWLTTPAWLLRLGLGEMSVLLLGGQYVSPRRTQDCGFVWRHPDLAAALADALATRATASTRA